MFDSGESLSYLSYYLGFSLFQADRKTLESVSAFYDLFIGFSSSKGGIMNEVAMVLSDSKY